VRSLPAIQPTPASPPRRRRALTALLAAGVLALTACGSSDSSDPTSAADTVDAATRAQPTTTSAPVPPTAVGAWIKTTDGNEVMTDSGPELVPTAAFLELTNPGDTTVTLTSASTPVAGRVELHVTEMVDGQMKMQQKEGGFEIPAGETYRFEPGGDHIMLMDLTEALPVGDEVPLTLEFDNGATLELTVPVKPFTADDEPYDGGEHTPGMHTGGADSGEEDSGAHS
jgi:copper(I)-binding protein